MGAGRLPAPSGLLAFEELGDYECGDYCDSQECCDCHSVAHFRFSFLVVFVSLSYVLIIYPMGYFVNTFFAIF